MLGFFATTVWATFCALHDAALHPSMRDANGNTRLHTALFSVK